MKYPKGLILCTEDDADTRELIVFILESAGFEAVCVDSAEKAVAKAQQQRFDLYLVDSWLPGVPGDELCKKLREFDAETPILFYSGAASIPARRTNPIWSGRTRRAPRDIWSSPSAVMNWWLKLSA